MSDEGPYNGHTERHLRHCRHRGWNLSRRRKVDVNREAEAAGQAAPGDVVLKYMLPLLALVPLKYQGKVETLFEDNPVAVWSFIAATCVYCLIVEAMKQMATLNHKCVQILSRAAVASALLSAVSLLSVLLPHHFSLAPLIMWTLVPVVLAWPMLYRIYNLLHTGISSIVDKVHAKVVVWGRGCKKLTEKASVPV